MKIIVNDFEKRDQSDLKIFCQSIYRELDWDWNYVIDLEDIGKYYKEGNFLIAKKENKIIGCGGLIGLNNKMGLIKRVYVAKEYRGKEVAKVILEKLEELAFGKYQPLVIDVLKTNKRAKKFYIKNGFQKFIIKKIDNWEETNSLNIFDFYRK